MRETLWFFEVQQDLGYSEQASKPHQSLRWESALHGSAFTFGCFCRALVWCSQSFLEVRTSLRTVWEYQRHQKYFKGLQSHEKTKKAQACAGPAVRRS